MRDLCHSGSPNGLVGSSSRLVAEDMPIPGEHSPIARAELLYRAARQGMLKSVGDTTNARAHPAGQTLGQTPNFRQTAPEIRCQSRVCGSLAAQVGAGPCQLGP